MSGLLSMDEIREMVGLSVPSSLMAPKAYNFTEHVGSLWFFKRTQELRFRVVGEVGPEEICVETWDLRDDSWKLTRGLVIEKVQVPELLELLLQAEVKVSDLGIASSESLPAFPISVGEACSATSTLRVAIGQFNGRHDVKVSKALGAGLAGRSGEWLKLRPSDLREVMRWIITAFDALSKPVDSRLLVEDLEF